MRICFFLIVGFVFVQLRSIGQVADTIELSFTKSAYLVFDDSTLLYDVGSENVFIRHNNNKLILQAQEEDFEETNLLVESNGQLRVFIVRYVQQPRKYLYQYTTEEKVVVPVVVENKAALHTDSVTAILMQSQSRILNRGVVRYKLGIYLRDCVISDNKYYLKFEAINKSNIDYNLDFFAMNVVNVKRRIKGESKQLLEITSISGTKLPEKFSGKSSTYFIVVVDPFVLTQDKKLKIDFWEKNGKDLDYEGGRKVSFDLFSKDLLNIKRII